MKRFLTGVCAAAVAACVAIPGLAEEKKPPQEQAKKRNPEQVFKRLDANGDQKLSLDEFKGKREEAAAKKAFDAKDADKDGSLTFAEYSAEQPAAKGAPEKPQRTPEERFARLDKNGDKSVSFDEYKGKREEAQAKTQFDRQDADKDGKLTLEEFKAKPKKEKNP
jgi:hypothetical protein